MRDIFDNLNKWEKEPPYTLHSATYYIRIRNNITDKGQIKERYGKCFYTGQNWFGIYKGKGNETYTITEIFTGLLVDGYKVTEPLKTTENVFNYISSVEDKVTEFLRSRGGQREQQEFEDMVNKYLKEKDNA